MTDRPIIFSAPMVRALIDGRKTQTRRILKGVDPNWTLDPTRAAAAEAGYFWFTDDPEMPGNHCHAVKFATGDRLWVRENWTASGTGLWTITDARRQIAPDQEVHYAADERGFKWWPSIHMPREFSRLTLIVEAVKVERLHDISDADALAEGAYVAARSKRIADDYASMAIAGRWFATPKGWYRDLWIRIIGEDSWFANPWVVAPTFRVIKANIDAPEARAA